MPPMSIVILDGEVHRFEFDTDAEIFYDLARETNPHAEVILASVHKEANPESSPLPHGFMETT